MSKKYKVVSINKNVSEKLRKYTRNPPKTFKKIIVFKILKNYECRKFKESGDDLLK